MTNILILLSLWKRFQLDPHYLVRSTPPSMGVTIYDLARAAGVGIGTVSRCLNNHPSVSAATRAKVLSVVRQLNYQPHTYAQRLAARRTNTIAAIIPYFTNYFFLQVLQGVQDRTSEAGLDLILYGVNNPAQKEVYLRKSLQRGKVDGALLFSLKLPEAYADKFEQMGLPLVLVDGYHPRFDSIRVENREGARTVTLHLLRQGHRSIALVSANPEAQPARERIDGFRDAIADYGLELPPERIVFPDAHRLDGFSREAGHDALRRLLPLLHGEERVTAVVVSSDIQAIGFMESAREQGISIPGDLALVSFDDIELAQHFKLTTMRQPMYEMGVLAIDRLVARWKNPDSPPTVVSFVPQLVVRESCGTVREKRF